MKWTRLCRRNLVLGLSFLGFGLGMTIGLLLPGTAITVLVALALIALGVLLLK